MVDDVLQEQAIAVNTILRRLMRRINVLHDDDPAMELPVAQLRVCGILRDGPKTMTALSKDLGISLSAITQIADRLERSDMVERVNETDDRRVKSLRLTSRGVEIIEQRMERRTHRVVQALARISPEARQEVLVALGVLLDASLAADPDVQDVIPMPESLV